MRRTLQRIRHVALPACLLAIATVTAAQESTPPFRRGDLNGDGELDIADPVHLLVHAFGGAGSLACADAADADDDGQIVLTDAVRLLQLLFIGGAALPAPFGVCGSDPTTDGLDCRGHAACAGSGVASLSDTFDGAALDPAWTVLRPNLVAVTVADGALTLRAQGHSLWYNASRGPLVHKLVTGDFRVTARVRARRASQPEEPPALFIHLGGLMARSPASETGGPENYVFIVVGRDEDGLAVETKTTTGSQSVYQGPAWPSGDAELRLCRVGSTFRLFKRALGGAEWTLAATYSRSDLPATLQVGPFIYAADPSADLIVTFDEVVFAEADAADDCGAP